MKNYLSMNTMYLTSNGFKYIHEINEDDFIIYKDIVGNICKTKDFTINTEYFNEIYDNYDSKYCRLVSTNSECPKSITSINKQNTGLNISKFYIKSHDKEPLWYTDISYEDTLCLSFILSNFFLQDEDSYIFRNNSIDNRYIVNIFKVLNDYLKIYFPYSKSLKTYTFKTDLFLNYDDIELKLINNLKYSKQLIELLFRYKVLRGNDYKCLLLSRYSLACIIQTMFNLNGYDTKVEKDSNFFKLTIINSSKITYAHKNTSTKLTGAYMNNITLNNDDGYLICSQNNNATTNISFIKSIQ